MPFSDAIECDDFQEPSQLSMKVPGGVASVFCRQELGSGLFQILIGLFGKCMMTAYRYLLG